ncbi:nuclear transport factor 2 family protein [Streptomyces sp. NPDC013178]|uniref:nuclear transport factor 2 family protein n=1 Tax=unclassified Streptomyces TaxID=2593676 RepID=UPI0033C27EE6
MSAEEVTQLVFRERQSRDRRRYEDMATCFADDSIVRKSWFTGSGADYVRQTRGMAGRGEHAVHRHSPPVVRIDGDRALVELPLVIEWRINLDGMEADLASACRSQYRPARHRRTVAHRADHLDLREGHPRPGPAGHPARRRPGRTGRLPAVLPVPGLVPAPQGLHRRRSPPR